MTRAATASSPSSPAPIRGATTTMPGGRRTSISRCSATSFLSRLVTQMYFPGDPLFAFDPIFNSIPDEKARAAHGLDASTWRTPMPEWALGYRFDIVLRGRNADADGALRQWSGITPSQTVGPFFAVRPRCPSTTAGTDIITNNLVDAATPGRAHPHRGPRDRRRRRAGPRRADRDLAGGRARPLRAPGRHARAAECRASRASAAAPTDRTGASASTPSSPARCPGRTARCRRRISSSIVFTRGMLRAAGHAHLFLRRARQCARPGAGARARGRRATLIAQRATAGRAAYRFDILQGERDGVLRRMTLPLEGLLVVALEQAVAAPTCTCRLADAGARVIKIERPEGDFARGYDDAGAAARARYFVWLNRGKESVVLDLDASRTTRRCSRRMLAKADVFVQNLKPGAIAKLGFAVERLRRDHPRLIVLLDLGLRRERPLRRAQGLRSAGPGRERACRRSPAARRRRRASASRSCDIAAGMNAYAAVLEALLARGRTGEGAAHQRLAVRRHGRLDDGAAAAARGRPAAAAHRPRAPLDRALRRVQDADGVDILISIQNDREWRVLAEQRAGRCRARGRSRLRHQRRARRSAAPTPTAVSPALRGAIDAEALRKSSPPPRSRSPASTTWPRWHAIRICAASRSSPPGPRPPIRRRPRRGRRHAHYGAVPALGAHTDAVRAEFPPKG